MPKAGRSRCRICHRPGMGTRRRRADWAGRCRTCADYFRRHGRERPWIFNGRKEKHGQMPLGFAKQLQAK